MPVEELIREYDKQKAIIAEAQKKQDGIIEQLRNADKEAYDWITVKKASDIFRISVPTIYRLINNGRLNTKRILSKIFINKKEFANLNDKYKG